MRCLLGESLHFSETHPLTLPPHHDVPSCALQPCCCAACNLNPCEVFSSMHASQSLPLC